MSFIIVTNYQAHNYEIINLIKCADDMPLIASVSKIDDLIYNGNMINAFNEIM